MGKKNNSGMDSNKCGPFVIKVDHFQNETWQGRIIWAEENRTERFRSTLELIGLINEAIGVSREYTGLSDDEKIL